jgi:serine/threonine protein kinase
MNQDYDNKSDVWSLGCILFELFKQSKLNSNSIKVSRDVLFRGDSCFTYSPLVQEKGKGLNVSKHDQMKLILQAVPEQEI